MDKPSIHHCLTRSSGVNATSFFLKGSHIVFLSAIVTKIVRKNCIFADMIYKSLKKNIIYSSILTAANYIFPLITYPYVSRVLGVDNIGACNFVDSVINYFILFSMLGISTVGIREISQARSDRDKLNQTFSRLFTINTVSTTVVLLVLLVSMFTVPQLRENSHLMWIGVLKLISNYLLIEWLYKGLEEFKYITSRTVLVKCLYVVAVFLFIKSPADTTIYYMLLTLMITGNALINIVHSRKYVSYSLSLQKSSPLFKAIVILGIYAFLTSMYTTFNVVYLGFECGDTEVGYYATSTKIYRMILSVFTAVTGVMMPRLASLLSERKFETFRSLLKKSFRILFVIFIPTSLAIGIFAPQIIHLIAGAGYEGAIMPLRIISPLLLIIGLEQIIIIQGLMPMKKDKEVLINSAAGALTGIITNLILVPEYGATGAAISWFAAECVVLTSSSIFFLEAMKTIPHTDNIQNS